jgi:hypothetical protein
VIVSFTPQAERQCGGCRFWKQRDYEGECRRYAPAPSSEHPVEWPDTRSEDWCGEWEPKDGAS